MCTSSLYTHFRIIKKHVYSSVSTQGSQSACGEALSQPGEPVCRQLLAVWDVSSRHGGRHFTRPCATSSAVVCSSVKTTVARLGGELSECVVA